MTTEAANKTGMEAFFTLHTGLPREGPGSDATTREALRRLPRLPRAPRVLDVGCGPGRQTLVLVRELNVPVEAIDVHQPYLDRLREAAAAAGLSERVRTRRLSMDALDHPPGSIDLIWSEGAVYLTGVARALRLWRPLLRPKGIVAFTEITWFTGTPPPEAVDFLRAYAGMASLAENVRRIEAEGYEVFDHFALPPEDWWDEYYTPLRQRVAALRRGAVEPTLAAVLDETEREIDLYARCGESYGYVFYLTRKKG